MTSMRQRGPCTLLNFSAVRSHSSVGVASAKDHAPDLRSTVRATMRPLAIALSSASTSSTGTSASMITSSSPPHGNPNCRASSAVTP